MIYSLVRKITQYRGLLLRSSHKLSRTSLKFRAHNTISEVQPLHDLNREIEQNLGIIIQA